MRPYPFFRDRRFWIIAIGIVVSCGLILLITFIWNRSLKRQVEIKTRELDRELEERRRTQKILEQNELFLNSVFDSIKDGICVLDTDLNIRRTNRTIKQWYRSSLPLEGKKCYQVYRCQDKPCEPCPTLRCMRSGKPESNIVPGLPGSGNKWIELFSYPMRDAATGRVQGAVMAIHDITEIRQSNAKLKESEARLRTITDGARDGIVMMDPDGAISFWNPAAEMIFGYTEKEAIGSNLHKLLAMEQYYSAYLKGFAGFKDTGQGVAVGRILELWARHKDGREIPIELSLSSMKLGDGWHAVGVIRDIRQRKQTEAEREKLLGQLLQAQKMESVGRLAGGVAHDFNNMLSVIIGNAELTLAELTPDRKERGKLEEILKAAHRSREITRQLLAFARRQTIKPRVLDLNQAVEGMLKMLGRLIGEDIDLAWMPGKDLWPVKVDPSQMDQVLANLCVNARDAISGAGKITIETANVVFDKEYCDSHPGFFPGQYVMLAVSDDGSGMEKEFLEYIFEPFFTTKEKGQGTGLGLSMVYGIVNQNRGFINVYSEPDQGSTFKIYIPRHVGQVPEASAENDPLLPEGKGETILLVEDEDLILKMGQEMLEKLGYKVITANSPAKALRQVADRSEKIDLMITDVVMPGMNGRQLADKMQRFNPAIKILYMSGYTSNVIVHRGVLEKGVHLIQKPFSIADLAVMVKKALEKGSDR